VLLLGTGSAQAAGVLLTAELTALGTRGVSCSVVNGGKADAEVTIDLVETTGVVVLSEGPLVIAPGKGRSARALGGNLDTPHCKVTVSKGPKRSLRVALCVHEGASTLTSPCIASAEGR
jgi:hypothetical protein